jgi:uncharacterized protein
MTSSTNYEPSSGKQAFSSLTYRAVRRALVFPFLALIRLYQWAISPFLPSACRFYPSCSHYAYEALERHGVARGGYLATRRVLRCHPWNPGGVDPVPERRTSEGCCP